MSHKLLRTEFQSLRHSGHIPRIQSLECVGLTVLHHRNARDLLMSHADSSAHTPNVLCCG
jgi:hypothetical protein